jgi:mono/diheme cytochrome c family protein
MRNHFGSTARCFHQVRPFDQWFFESSNRFLWVTVTLLTLLAPSHAAELSTTEPPTDTIDYSRDIRPILSANCFACHGPDPETREADVRLDKAEYAYADLGGAAAIVPNDPAKSLIIERIEAEDESMRMPPADSDKQLSAEQISLLRRWIAAGATYTGHWAFVPPSRPALPQVNQAEWPRNAIDQFVLARLEAANLTPSPPADPYTLVRRVYLDLIGLPPTPEEADAFVQDSRPDAYERLVDQLLASPHYGERWARRWLDLARYSDTNGYEKDRPRSIWPFRDWVIQALNDDMPFDQFTIEQLAGDMLPDASQDQRIATGFHRNTMINEEGGIDPEEFRFLANVDRVATTGTTWLGLTVGCAQCHSHKYDPISHQEYYRLFAFFNNANDVEMDVRTKDIQSEREQIESKIAAIEAKLVDEFPLPDPIPADSQLNEAELRAQHLEKTFQAWYRQAATDAVAWSICRPEHVESNLPSVDLLDDQSLLISGDQTKNDTFVLSLAPKQHHITAIRLEALPHESLPEGGPGRRSVGQGASAGVGDFFLTKFQVTHVAADGNECVLPLTAASETFAAPNRSAASALDGKGDTGWSIAGRPGERHVAVFRLAEPLTLKPTEKLLVRLEHESFYPSGLGCFRLAVTDDARPIEASGVPAAIEQLLLVPSLTDEHDWQQLRKYHLSIAPELDQQHEKIAELRKQMPAYPTTMVLSERPPHHARTSHVHHRGEFLKPTDVVQPSVPEILHPWPADAPANRLSLARWLVSRDNPLVARVTVNRQWQGFFGRGIVPTLEDFGMQGELPTHPQLLDWLAVEFMDCGWSIKKLHRLIVTSATYRQSARVSDELLEQDPENRLLARGPRFRLDAELIRDAILGVSGLLSDKLGGPSVYPSQPPGITEAAYGPLNWVLSQGADRYRRGLYTFNKRTAPYVAFSLFDGPSGESCVARRVNSNTPLQALNLLNDPVVSEAAQALGREMFTAGISDERARAEYLLRRCLTRPPESAEVEIVTAFYQRQHDRLLANEIPALPILGAGIHHTWTFQDGLAGWQARNQVQLDRSEGRLRVISTGNDPFLGTELAAPAGRYGLTIRAKFGVEGQGQIFWTTSENPAESATLSTTFDLVPNQWHTYRVPLEFGASLKSLRLDPGASEGESEIESMQLEYGDGTVTLPAAVDVHALAAWTLVARGLLNLDEMLTKP